MQRLIIEQKEQAASTKRGKPRKTRAFGALKLAHVVANDLWDGGKTDTDTIRPILMVLAGTDTELRPFVANLRAGRRVEVTDGRNGYSRDKPTRYELLKTGGYSYAFQHPESQVNGWIVTAYQADLLQVQTGMIDPTGCRFVALPSRDWVAQQVTTIRENREHAAAILAHAEALGVLGSAGVLPPDRLLPVPVSLTADDVLHYAVVGAYACAYLQARTRRPLVADEAFYLQLYLAGLMDGTFSLAQTRESYDNHRYYRDRSSSGDAWLWARHKAHAGFQEFDIQMMGFLPGIACNVTHDNLDTFLAREVARYMQARTPVEAEPAPVPEPDFIEVADLSHIGPALRALQGSFLNV